MMSNSGAAPRADERWGVVVRGLAVCAVVVAVVGVGGLLALDDPERWAVLDLDGEFTVPAAVSALALLAAGGVLLVAARRLRDVAVGLVGALLTFMAFDEYLVLHERLESMTKIDWQKLYLPIFAAAGVGFLVVAYRRRALRSFLLPWCLGAALWFAAQVLERLEWRGHIKLDHYTQKMVAEELFELAGTGCFLVAGLVLLVVASRAGAAGTPPREPDRQTV